MILFRSILSSLLLISSAIGTSVSATGLNEHPGHDASRKSIANAAKTSNNTVNNKVLELLRSIRSGEYAKDQAHNEEIEALLNKEHKQWLEYRELHCWLQSYVYVYPANSRMAASEYHACQLEMNEKRIKFLDDIRYEYQN